MVAEDRRLFTFGDNSLAQLGRAPHQAAADRSAEDWLVKDADGTPLLVASAAAGLSHCLAITECGKVCLCPCTVAAGGSGVIAAAPERANPRIAQVLVWGWNHGLRDLPDTQQLPAAVPGITPGRARLVAAGRVHSLVATDAGLLSFGNGQNGRLGTGSSQSSAAPEVVPGHEDVAVEQLACGHDHSLVLTSS